VPVGPAVEEVKEQDMVMPLQAIRYEISAQNSVLKSRLSLTYINDNDNKVEAMLEMPTDPDRVISRMKIRVGDTEITGLIKEKEKAAEMYEDALARGHTAGLLKLKDQEKVLQMTVGNIESKQIVNVEIDFIQQAKIFEGAY
jgi:hypothetical protein